MSYLENRELINQNHQLMDYASICAKHCQILKDLSRPVTDDHMQCLYYCATHVRMCIDYSNYWDYTEGKLNLDKQ